MGLFSKACFRINQSPLAVRFLGGAAWSLIGTIVSQSLILVTMIFIARFLGKEIYGQFVVLQSTLNMIGVFAGFGIGTTATRYVAELRLRDKYRLAHVIALIENSIVILGLFVSAIFAIFSVYIARDILNQDSLATPLEIAAVSVFFLALDGYQKSVLIGLESMRIYAIVNIIGAVAGLPINLVLAHKYGLNGIAIAMVISSCIQFGVSRFFVQGQLKLYGINRKSKGCSVEWRVLRDFALPSLLGGLLVAPAHWACQALLANTHNGYSELAILGVAMQWFNIAIFFPSIAGRVLLPILTEHFSAGDYAQSAKFLRLAIIANLIIVVPFSAVIALASPWIMLAYGPEFEAGSISLMLAGLIAIFYVGAFPVGQILAARGHMWIGAFMNFGWASIYIGSAFILIQYGATGAMMALGIAYLVHSIWVGGYVFRDASTANAKSINH